jgi:hypothetical protein
LMTSRQPGTSRRMPSDTRANIDPATVICQDRWTAPHQDSRGLMKEHSYAALPAAMNI